MVNSNATQHAGMRDGVRFGRTLLVSAWGKATEQGADVIACPANRRGAMGVGAAGAIRLAGGADVEREIMAMAPLTLGLAYATSAGLLAERGIRAVIHAVVAAELGAPSREDIVRRATAAVLTEADRLRAHHLVLPPIGAGLGPEMLSPLQVKLAMIEETVAHLRRNPSRIECISFLNQDERDARAINEVLIGARALWTGI